MLNAVRVWILSSTMLAASGWILSAFHQLNRIGYGMVFALAAMAGIYRLRKTKWHLKKTPAQLGRKFLKRFKRPPAFLFLSLLVLSLLAGALYVPTNGDSDAYRTPRVLHWLAAGQWHWIHTLDVRMNISACGFEWLTAPLILFARDQRPLFLINLISYALLPGLVYGVFTRLGVRPRVAWWWMWVLSSGWCFVLQAGSIVNDSFAAIYALAAVDLALRAKEKNSAADLCLSMLAAALITGAKQSDILLVLLWLIAAWPAFPLLKRHAIAAAVAAAFGSLISILPTTIFNLRHFGNWMGFEASQGGFELNSPFWGIVGNAFCLPAQNLMPPFFPWSDQWNALMDRFVATPFGHHFASFEHFGQLSVLSHSIGEGNAGIGLGICLFTMVSIFAARRISKNARLREDATVLPRRLLRMAPWALLLLFMARVGTYQNARQLAPYYAFLFPLFLAKPGNALLVRRRWWQWFGLMVMLSTVGLLVVSRNRPLFPAQTMVHWLRTGHPNSQLIARLDFSFEANAMALEQGKRIAKDLPPDEKLIGYATLIGSAEPALWFPLGQRRVYRLTMEDTPEELKAQGIRDVVVDSNILNLSRETIGQWMDTYQAALVDTADCQTQPGLPPFHLYLVRLQP